MPVEFRWKSGESVLFYIDSVPGDINDENQFREEISDAYALWQIALSDEVTFSEISSKENADVILAAGDFCHKIFGMVYGMSITLNLLQSMRQQIAGKMENI
jgi:hypothetical protein